jgi:hypothetical protein
VLGYGLAVFGAIKVKDTAAISAKYVQRAGAAAKDYTDGVASAGGDWETGAKNGEQNFEQGIQEAIADKRYGKGISGSAGKYVAERDEARWDALRPRRDERPGRVYAGRAAVSRQAEIAAAPAEGSASESAESAAREHGRAGTRQAETGK